MASQNAVYTWLTATLGTDGTIQDLKFKYFSGLSGLTDGTLMDHRAVVLNGSTEIDYWNSVIV